MIPVVEACVQRLAGRAWCGNLIEHGAFMFCDEKHVIKFYDRSPRLQACPNCVIAIKKESDRT
jgi:hypothetical protein